MRINLFRLFALLLCAAPLCSAHPPAKSVRAVRTSVPPVLDGAVVEREWQNAPPVMDLTQAEPVEGSRPSELTSIRLLYDDRNLYVGVICYDAKPEGIVQQLSRRDRSTEADRFTVLIDSYFDRKSAFVFVTNVTGVQSDGILSQGGTVYDLTWDAVWEVKTRVYIDGWSAEFAIPFNALRFTEEEAEHRWGVNFRRYISRKKEVDAWVMVPRTDPYEIGQWGTLEGIAAIRPSLRLEFSPYVAASTTIQTQPASTDNTVRAGVDVKYGLSRNFTLDAAINPDFGQVEVDQAVLNLTVFETLYPEKRPFFVEGAQFFTFGSSYDNTPLPLFFSRRIGRRPFYAPAGSSTLLDIPSQTTILGAAKLSGRNAAGLSIGAISALTDQEDAAVRDSSGVERSFRAEPRASYNVLRMRQEFSGGSWVGGIGTIAARATGPASFSGGIDWNLHFAEETHSLDGYVAGARAWSGGRWIDGTAGRLLLSRISGSHWGYLASYDFASPRFSINDLGFFARPHEHGGYAQLLYRMLSQEGEFLQYGGSVTPEARWNWDGIRTTAQIEANLFGMFTSFWTVQLGAIQRFPAFDDAERGLIGTYLRPSSTQLTFQLSSDERNDLSVRFIGQQESDAHGRSSIHGYFAITLRPTRAIAFTPSLLLLRSRGEEAAVISSGRIVTASVGGEEYSLFADRDLDELDAGFKGILTFTRALSLQFTTQLLIARGKYAGYRRLVEPSRFERDVPPGPSADFNEAVFNANALLRWEFVPGSALYLVWTQFRYGDSRRYATTNEERIGEAFALPHEDAIFLKAQYWIPL